MTSTVETMGAREPPEDQVEQLFGDGWPEFITADQVVKEYIGTVRQLFADLELVLLDGEDVPVAAGWAVPLRWDGGPDKLPSGYSDSLVRAVSDHAGGRIPDTLVVMAAQVHPGRRGWGLAGEVITAMRRLADQRGWAPRHRPGPSDAQEPLPLTPIEQFASWSRADGLPLDPWLRTHQRLGAKIIATAPASQTMTGTVSQWEDWAGMRFPDSSVYVIPDGLSTLRIDADEDIGVYVEPNVWMQHQ